MREELLPFDISDTRDFIDERRNGPFGTSLAVEPNGFSVGFIADSLEKK